MGLKSLISDIQEPGAVSSMHKHKQALALLPDG